MLGLSNFNSIYYSILHEGHQIQLNPREIHQIRSNSHGAHQNLTQFISSIDVEASKVYFTLLLTFEPNTVNFTLPMYSNTIKIKFTSNFNFTLPFILFLM